MILAIFDLDDTLTLRDTESLWQEFLAEQGLISRAEQQLKKKEFQEAYEQGRLNFQDVLAYSIRPLESLSAHDQHLLRHQFQTEALSKIILPNAQKIVQSHADKGHFVIILSAGHHFLIEPAASFFPVDVVLCSRLKMGLDGKFIPEFIGKPLYREEKLHALEHWLQKNQVTPSTTYFYSDSINDLPLLEQVDIPIAVNPCARLKEIALLKDWSILELKKEHLLLQEKLRENASA